MLDRANNDPSIFFFTLARGSHSRIFFEKKVHYAPLCSRHSWETERALLSHGTTGSTVRHALQGLYATLSITLRVDNDPLCKRTVLINNHVNEVLNCVYRLAFPTYEEPCFLGSYAC